MQRGSEPEAEGGQRVLMPGVPTRLLPPHPRSSWPSRSASSSAVRSRRRGQPLPLLRCTGATGAAPQPRPPSPHTPYFRRRHHGDRGHSGGVPPQRAGRHRFRNLWYGVESCWRGTGQTWGCPAAASSQQPRPAPPPPAGAFWISVGVYGTIRTAGIFFLDSPKGQEALTALFGVAAIGFMVRVGKRAQGRGMRRLLTPPCLFYSPFPALPARSVCLW